MATTTLHVVAIKVVLHVVAGHSVLLLVELILVQLLLTVVSKFLLLIATSVEGIHLAATTVREAWIVLASAASSASTATMALVPTWRLHAGARLRFLQFIVAVCKVALVSHLAVPVVRIVPANGSLILRHVDLLLWVSVILPVGVLIHRFETTHVLVAVFSATILVQWLVGPSVHALTRLGVLRLCFFSMVLLLLIFFNTHMLALRL